MTRAAGTALVAGASLVSSFAVAELSGVRWVGGVVLLAGGLWCVARQVSVTPWWKLVLVVGVALAGFVASHRFSDLVGAWPSVIGTSVLVALVAWVVLRSPQRSVRVRRV